MVRTWAEKEMRNLIRLVLWLLFLLWTFYDCLSIMRIYLSQDYRPHRFQVQSPSCCGVMFSSWALLVEMTCTWAFTFTIYRCTNTSQHLIQTWQCFRVFDKFLNDTPGFLSDFIGVFLRPAPLLKKRCPFWIQSAGTLPTDHPEHENNVQWSSSGPRWP